MPTPGPGEILIRVAAAGVNRPDVLQRQGHYPPPPGASDLPGLEVAGEVAALGEGAARFRLGDKVCALAPGGGYAQFCKVHATNALPIPKGLTMVEAAAIPETFFTVWTNVFDRGHLQKGRELPGAWRKLRHRHHGDHAGQGLRRARLRDGGLGREMRELPQARRRSRHRLPRAGFRRGGERRDRGQGGRSHPRHGRRRLRAAQLRGGGRGRPHRADRLPQGLRR